jgi:hypothetical protein
MFHAHASDADTVLRKCNSLPITINRILLVRKDDFLKFNKTMVISRAGIA